MTCIGSCCCRGGRIRSGSSSSSFYASTATVANSPPRLFFSELASSCYSSSLMIGSNNNDHTSLPLLELSAEESFHAMKVLRLRPGDEVDIIDGKGHILRAAIEKNASERRHQKVFLRPLRPMQFFGWSDKTSIDVFVACSTLKGGRSDWMIEKISEIGARRFTPLQCSRSILASDGDSKKRERKNERQMKKSKTRTNQSKRMFNTYHEQETNSDSYTHADIEEQEEESEGEESSHDEGFNTIIKSNATSTNIARYERWLRVRTSAQKQCLRLHELEMRPPLQSVQELSEYLQSNTEKEETQVVLIADQESKLLLKDAIQKIMILMKEIEMTCNDNDNIDNSNDSGITDGMNEAAENESSDVSMRISIVIGPEGDFTNDEKECLIRGSSSSSTSNTIIETTGTTALHSNDDMTNIITHKHHDDGTSSIRRRRARGSELIIMRVNLGTNRLRTETAAVAMVSALQLMLN